MTACTRIMSSMNTKPEGKCWLPCQCACSNDKRAVNHAKGPLPSSLLQLPPAGNRNSQNASLPATLSHQAKMLISSPWRQSGRAYPVMEASLWSWQVI